MCDTLKDPVIKGVLRVLEIFKHSSSKINKAGLDTQAPIMVCSMKTISTDAV